MAVPPVAGLPGDLAARVLAIPVLRRPGGFLLALPDGSVPPALLEGGLQDPPSGIIGPSTALLVPGAEESEEGVDVPVEEDLQVLIVDYDDAALQFLTPFDPASPEPVVPFSQARPSVFPDGAILLARVNMGERLERRGARGGEGADGRRSSWEEPPGHPKTKAKAKRVTTAQLADHLGSLLTLMPALTAQVQELASRPHRDRHPSGTACSSPAICTPRSKGEASCRSPPLQAWKALP